MVQHCCDGGRIHGQRRRQGRGRQTIECHGLSDVIGAGRRGPGANAAVESKSGALGPALSVAARQADAYYPIVGSSFQNCQLAFCAGLAGCTLFISSAVESKPIQRPISLTVSSMMLSTASPLGRVVTRIIPNKTTMPV